jgi:hypothetical protein
MTAVPEAWEASWVHFGVVRVTENLGSLGTDHFRVHYKASEEISHKVFRH